MYNVWLSSFLDRCDVMAVYSNCVLVRAHFMVIMWLQVLKVAILAEKYAIDYTWYVDVILNLIRMAGDYVSEEVRSSWRNHLLILSDCAFDNVNCQYKLMQWVWVWWWNPLLASHWPIDRLLAAEQLLVLTPGSQLHVDVPYSKCDVSLLLQVWYRVIQIVTNRDDVQGYAAKTVFEARRCLKYMFVTVDNF